MEYLAQAFFNETRGSRFERYELDVTLVPSKLEPFYVSGDTPEQAANQAWECLNDDLRPNGKYERSLSVGDLVKLTRQAQVKSPDLVVVIWLAVEGRGFRQVDGPIIEEAGREAEFTWQIP